MNILQKISRKFYGGCAIVGAAALLFTSYGQIDQFSGPRNNAADPTTQTLDLTISLYRPWSDLTPALRAEYEQIIRFWADGIFEMTNGGHRLGKIRIFSDGHFNNTADVVWVENAWPNANLNGFETVNTPAPRIQMCDNFSGWSIPGADWDHQAVGYCLAHESGHYIYSLFDEYRNGDLPSWPWFPNFYDIPVIPSIMNSQWSAINGNFDWLNVSSPCNWSVNTAHGRMWNTDAWSLLIRDPALDPDIGIGTRAQYPVLNNRSPGMNCMDIDLPSTNARENLVIIWMGNTIDVDLILDKSGSMWGTPIEDVKTAAKAFVTAIDDFGTTMELVPSIGVSAFSSTPDNPTTYPMTILNGSTLTPLMNVIDALTANGATAIYDACLVSLNKLTSYSSTNSVRLSMLLTDGEENSSVETDPANVITPFVDANVPIYTFGYGDGASHQNCIELSDGTGGSFYANLTDAAQVVDEWLRIFDNAADLQYTKEGTFDVATGLNFTIDPTVYSCVIQVTYELQNASSYCTFTIRDNANVQLPTTIKTIPLSDTYPRKEIALINVSSDVTSNAQIGNWKCSVSSSGLVSSKLKGTVRIKGDENGTFSLAISEGNKGYYTYPNPFHLSASVGKNTHITGLNVIATLTSPSGKVANVVLNDNGTNGDKTANDGIYSTDYYNYKENGQYTFFVHMDNTSGSAYYALDGVLYSVDNNGTMQRPVTKTYINENFAREKRVYIHVSNGPVFVNPHNLKVYSKIITSDNQKSEVLYYVENAGTSTISNFTAKYFFSNAEAPNQTPQFQDSYSPDSRVTGLTNTGTDWTLTFSFDGKTLAPTQKTSNGPFDGEHAILSYVGWPSNWDISNDYSGRDLTSTFQLTEYINIYDSNGMLIYGYPVGPGTPPIFSAIGNKTVAEGAALTFSATAVDPDGQPLKYRATSLPEGASLDSITGSFSWTPSYTQAGNYTVMFSVFDGSMTSTQTVVITVSNTNRAPVISSISNKTVGEGTALSFTVTATDPDGQALTYSATGLPTGATFNTTTRVFTWTPSYTQAGSYTVTFSASDGSLTASKAVVITVSNTNRAPVISAISNKTVGEGTALTFTVTATDPDGQTVTYSATGLPTGATFNTTTRVFTWTPSYTQAGSYTVTFSASDGSLTASKAVVITVTNTNRAPVISAISNKTVGEGTALTFTVTATDPDGQTVTYSATGLPTGATFNTTTRAFTWTPSYTQAGSYTVTFSASDGSLTASKAVVITVTNTNRAPVLASIGNKSATQTLPLKFTLSATDPDGQTITYSSTTLPAGATLNSTSGAFAWTPSLSQSGNFSVTFIASDGSLVASQTIIITVNSGPVAIQTEATSVNFTATDWVADRGKINVASFNGTNYQTIPNRDGINFGTGDFSVSLWVKTDGNYTVIDKRDANDYGYLLSIYNGVVLFQIHGPGGWLNYFNSSSKTVTDNQWHNIVVTIDRDNALGGRIYVDNVLQHQFDPKISFGSITNTAPLYIGQHKNGSKFVGLIDDFKLFNRVLAVEEVGTLFFN